jgi:hypothetical protein
MQTTLQSDFTSWSTPTLKTYSYNYLIYLCTNYLRSFMICPTGHRHIRGVGRQVAEVSITLIYYIETEYFSCSDIAVDNHRLINDFYLNLFLNIS